MLTRNAAGRFAESQLARLFPKEMEVLLKKSSYTAFQMSALKKSGLKKRVFCLSAGIIFAKKEKKKKD